MAAKRSLENRIVRVKSTPTPREILNIRKDQLPAIEDWMIGRDYKIEVTATMVGMRQPDEWERREMGLKKDDYRATFEIKALKDLAKSSKK